MADSKRNAASNDAVPALDRSAENMPNSPARDPVQEGVSPMDSLTDNGVVLSVPQAPAEYVDLVGRVAQAVASSIETLLQAGEHDAAATLSEVRLHLPLADREFSFRRASPAMLRAMASAARREQRQRDKRSGK
jgi:hypothetical protein